MASLTATQPQLLTREEAAQLLAIKPQTLAAWATTRRYGLPFVKVGRSVRYRLSDVLQFIEDHTVENGKTASE